MKKNEIVGALFGLASLLISFAVAGSEDEGASLAQAIIEATNRHVAASAPPLAKEPLRDLKAATAAIRKLSYYQVEVERLEEALEPAFAARISQGSVDRSALVRLGLEVLLDLIGNRAELLTAEQFSEAPEAPAANEHVRETRAGPLRIISLSRFGSHKLGECADVLENPESEPFEAIVLDLRGNPGGLLGSVTSIASQFLEPGAELFQFESNPRSVKSPGCQPSYRDVPLVVVIDAKTDSGALLLAAVLQAHNRAKLVGTTTDQPFGTVHTLWFSRSFVLKLPHDELVYGEDLRLSDGITVDVEADVTDDAQMIEAARSVLGS